jgi:hypothetical protein
MSGPVPSKGAQFLGQRIGQDALAIAELEAALTAKQRERLKAMEP